MLMFSNTFSFFNDTIDYSYHHNGTITNSNRYLSVMISLVFSWIVWRLLKEAFSFQRSYDRMVVDLKNDEEILSYFIQELIIKLKRSVIVFFVFDLVLCLFSWYYITLFSIVYGGAQENWIINFVICITVYVIVYFTLAILIACFHYFGIRCRSVCSYNIGLFLYFIM